MGKIKYREVYVDGHLIIEEIHKVVVYRFTMGDVEDPDLYAAVPLHKWETSEQGQFIMKNAVDKPEWHRHLDHNLFGYQYAITAELPKKKLSEYLLKWGPIK